MRAIKFENQLGPGRAADISTYVELSEIVVGASARNPLGGFVIKTRATEIAVVPVVVQIAVIKLFGDSSLIGPDNAPSGKHSGFPVGRHEYVNRVIAVETQGCNLAIKTKYRTD